MENEKYSLSWGEFNQSTSTCFKSLLNDTNFTDVTLACEDDRQLEVHKVIIGSSSAFFQNILLKNSHPHPLIYLKGIKFEVLQAIINFIYEGKTEVSQDALVAFIEAATELKIKGLDNHSQPDQFNFDYESYTTKQTSNIKEEKDEANIYQNPEYEDQMKLPKKERSMGSIFENLGDVSKRYDNFYSEDQEMASQFNKFYDSDTSNVLVLQDYDEQVTLTEEDDTTEWKVGRNQLECDECDRKFKNHINLRQHVLSKHKGVRYKCETCGKEYSQPQAMKRHVRTVHGGERNACDYCDMKAIEKSYIKAHMLNKHPMEMARDFNV